MSQLAEVHQQVVPMRTARALSLDSMTLVAKSPVQQTFQHLHVSISTQQSHPQIKEKLKVFG